VPLKCTEPRCSDIRGGTHPRVMFGLTWIAGLSRFRAVRGHGPQPDWMQMRGESMEGRKLNCES
jgi:hypothetical protein